MRRLIRVLAAAVLLVPPHALAQTASRSGPTSPYGLLSPSTSPSAQARAAGKRSVEHRYEVQARDAKGKPLEGVVVSMVFTSDTSPLREASCVTDASGACPDELYEVADEGKHPSMLFYLSKVQAQGTKDGYFSGTAVGSSSRESNLVNEHHADIRVGMVRPSDYLTEELRNSPGARELRERAEKFASVMRLEAPLGNAGLQLGSVGLSDFKGKKYLRLRVNVHWPFDTASGSQYLHAQEIFDRAASKVLSPLLASFGASSGYVGYDVEVVGAARNFSIPSVAGQKRAFRFLVPDVVVRKYREKDISGQALLNASVILLNDERIELTLK